LGDRLRGSPSGEEEELWNRQEEPEERDGKEDLRTQDV
jgi:hypothetical protein